MRWLAVRSVFWACAAGLLTIALAEAAGEKAGRPSEFILVVQVALLIAVGGGLGEIMQRIG